MANNYYEHDNPFVAGTLVASAAVNSQLDLIETGFEAAEATLAKTVQVPSDFTGITQIPSQTFPNKLIYINTAGNVDLYSLAAFDASVTAAAASAVDAATEVGLAAAQVTLATDQVGLAATQVGLAATEVGLAAAQVTLATDQVGLATTQVGLAADQVGLATTQVGLATGQVTLAADQVGLATTQAGLAAGSASDAANSATAAAAALPSGTTNSTMRYDGSNWAATDKLQIDSAGVVTATAGLKSEGAGANSFRAGRFSGRTSQGASAVAIGNAAGFDGQGDNAVAIGISAGQTSQGTNSVAIGVNAGYLSQLEKAVAIGMFAGYQNQKANAIAIGEGAGKNSQHANSIVISSKGSTLNSTAEGDIHLSSDEASLDYTNADGWSATDTAGTFSLRGSGGAFLNKPAGEPIFLLSTGQSNPQGYEPATVQFPVNANVFDYETTTMDTSAQSTDPAVNFSWRTPTPSEAKVTNPVGHGTFGYVGYLRGNTGHQAMACANALQVATGRDVYVLSICQGAAGIRWWEAGAYSYCKDLLESFVPYVLANTPALANISSPDVLMWGQSETNADPYYTPFDVGAVAGDDYLAPKDYVTRWQAVQESGYIEDYPSTGWRRKDTPTFLTEPTQKANWGPRDTAGTEYRWDGMNAVARYTSDATKLVSSMHLPLDGNGVGVLDVHYSGNGNNQYGERIAKAILGKVTAMSPASQELQRETLPILGGNLNTDGKSLVNGSLTYTMPASTGTLAITDDVSGLLPADAAGALTNNGSGTLTWTPAVNASMFGTRLVGSVTSTDGTWVQIMLVNPPNGLSDTGKYTGIATLESLITSGNAAVTQQVAVAFSAYVGLLIVGTISAPFGTGGLVANPPEIRAVASANGLSLQVRGVPAAAAVTYAAPIYAAGPPITRTSDEVQAVAAISAAGTVKHRLTYDYNDISGI